MIYLHKLLPLLFSPLVLPLLLATFGILRNRKFVLGIALLLLWIGSTPLVSDTLFRSIEEGAVKEAISTVPETDAIVVLSGMIGTVQAGPEPLQEWSDADRFWGGIDLYQAGKAPQLIFTGGLVPWEPDAIPEGQILRTMAIRMGVPEKVIQVTANAQNTEQEAEALGKLLPPEARRILLVTSAFHMPRAQRIFQKAGFSVHPFPVDFKVSAGKLTPMDFLPSVSALWLTDTAVREILGRTYYRIKLALR